MGIVRIPNGLRTLLRQLGIDANATTIPEIGAESDSASATGSLYAQVNKAQADIGASTDTASATGSLFARVAATKTVADGAVASLAVLAANATDVQTITLDTVIPTDAVSVAGTTFTAVAYGATGNEFNVGADDAATAVNLAAKINALSGVSATSDGAVVTVTADQPGIGVAIASADTTMVVASASATDLFGVIHDILVELGSLDDRLTAVEGE